MRHSEVNTFAEPSVRDVVIIGGGLAGLSAAIYLGRSRRDTVLVHSGHSMAKWESDVQNYLGFPDGIAGTELLQRGMAQAARFDVEILEDEIQSVAKDGEIFILKSLDATYRAKRVLMTTGLTHLPPDIPGVSECLGKSLFFCKDCDAYRVQGKRIAIIGRNSEAVDYALAMLLFSPSVLILTNGEKPVWDARHQSWLEEYKVPARRDRIRTVEHDNGQLRALYFDEGEPVEVDAVFTTRGDVPHTGLAEQLGVSVDSQGQIIVDSCLRTSVPGFYAAGCVTPANCQMIIAAGQGAIAAQAINRDLFEDSLNRHAVPRFDTCRPITEPAR